MQYISISEDNKMHISACTTKLKIKNILGCLKCPVYPFLVLLLFLFGTSLLLHVQF